MRPTPPDGAGAGRRGFLRHAAGQFATAALGAIAVAAPADAAQPDAFGTFDHLVVLRFGGRTFDAVLGRLDRSGADFRVGVAAHPLGWPVAAGSTDEVMTTPDAQATDVDTVGFLPSMLPVHSVLAREFATFAAWYSDGTDPAVRAIEAAANVAAGWCVYYDGVQGVSSIAVAHPHVAHDRSGSFDLFERFVEAAAIGRLPAVSIIEPRTFIDPADLATAHVTGRARSADVRIAEELLHRVYSAVRTSPGRASGEPDIALLVVSTDGGGGRDHRDRTVADGSIETRVPALLVSGFARSGAVVDVPVDHSFVSTLVRTRFGSNRAGQDAVRTLGSAVDASSYRPPVNWSRTAAAYLPRRASGIDPPDARLTTAAEQALALLEDDSIPVPRTETEALALVRAAGARLQPG